MTFLAPLFFYAALAVAAGIIALHFIVVRQPRSAVLPTARFVPDTRATAITAARHPSDIALMALRLLAVLATGAALARPAIEQSRRPVSRVILIDVSRSEADTVAVRDSARRIYRAGDAVVLFDSSARVVGGRVEDSLAVLRRSDKRGNLSAALIAALRAGSDLTDRADSLELAIVSPFADEEMDAATDSIRRLWPGKARIVKVPMARSAGSEYAGAGKLETNAGRDDPIAVTATLARPLSLSKALIDRQPEATGGLADSIDAKRYALTAVAGVLVEWPATGRPPRAVARSRTDTIGGITTSDTRVIAPFERRWTFPPDSLRGAEVIARWLDGDAAALEKPAAAGCIRSVAVPVAPVGDLAIRGDFVRFFASLSRPCVRQLASIPATSEKIARLEGAGGFAPREAFQPRADVSSPLAPWLLGLALLAAIAELFVRGLPATRNVSSVRTPSPRRRRAA